MGRKILLLLIILTISVMGGCTSKTNLESSVMESSTIPSESEQAASSSTTLEKSEVPIVEKVQIQYIARDGLASPSVDTRMYNVGEYTRVRSAVANWGYSFLGWSQNESSDLVTYLPGDRIQVTQDIILYPVVIEQNDQYVPLERTDPATRDLDWWEINRIDSDEDLAEVVSQPRYEYLQELTKVIYDLNTSEAAHMGAELFVNKQSTPLHGNYVQTELVTDDGLSYRFVVVFLKHGIDPGEMYVKFKLGDYSVSTMPVFYKYITGEPAIVVKGIHKMSNTADLALNPTWLAAQGYTLDDFLLDNVMWETLGGRFIGRELTVPADNPDDKRPIWLNVLGNRYELMIDFTDAPVLDADQLYMSDPLFEPHVGITNNANSVTADISAIEDTDNATMYEIEINPVE